ncbi:hypothetical protein BDV96DRAFT_689741 [Lophiotrema nucula]|uniref:Probable double zinc ribbon domain-containing protein n=1 Tax=Lophiotrema nucula TaxID=690887 RepID=A0A6A5Z0W5_9PLEO|nr:hypothetical protein BDV96DRAFT_689741 [Lophiotrema nucula]
MSSFQLPLLLRSTQDKRITIALPSPSKAPDTEPAGSWSCCKCHRVKDIHFQPGLHPIGTLSCDCSHKPCDSCNYAGDISYFVPISEPLLVPIHGDKSSSITPFGIICTTCGLSWRARKVGGLRKMPSLHSPRYTTSSLGLLRKTQSIGFMRNIKKDRPLNKDVKSTSVCFTGIKCTCGTVSDYRTAGFRVVDGAGKAEEPPKPTLRHPKRYTDLRLLAKGVDSPTITLGQVEHPNPLRSAPVFKINVESA